MSIETIVKFTIKMQYDKINVYTLGWSVIMTKYKVLKILKSAKGEYVSGEKISNEIGLSRMAISTAVKSLRNDGYEIESITNKGYLLKNNPDILNIVEISENLQYKRDNIIVLESIDSTNNYLKENYNTLPNKTIVVSDEQTMGKGRRGKRFESPKGTGIYLSYLFKPECTPSDVSSVSALAAIATKKAIDLTCNTNVSIKWVNDLVLNGKKITGILTEMSVEAESGHIEYLIVGIGINVNQKQNDFPDELKDIAGSIFSQTGIKTKRAIITAKLIEELDKLANSEFKVNKDLLKEYKNSCISLNKAVRVVCGNENYEAFATDINEDFSLKIKLSTGAEKNVSSGEVSVRGLYGYV